MANNSSLPPSPPPSTPPPDGESSIALDTTLIAVTLLVSLILQHALREQWLCKSLTKVLTGGGVCMLLGCFANGLIWFISRFDVGLRGHLSLRTWDSVQTHDLIYYCLLPPIIFEAGFHMNNKDFFQNLGTTLGFAVIGTVFAVMITAVLV